MSCYCFIEQVVTAVQSGATGGDVTANPPWESIPARTSGRDDIPGSKVVGQGEYMFMY